MPDKFTEDFLKRVTSNGKLSRFIADTEMPGLMLCVTAAGVKTFYVRWTDGETGRRWKTPLDHGRWPAMSVADARLKVRGLVGKIDAGLNPLTARKTKRSEAKTAPASLSVRGLIEAWEKWHLAGQRPDYRREAVRALKHDLDEHLSGPASGLTREKVISASEAMRGAGRNSAARHFVRYGSAMYGWAIRTGRATDNPFNGVPVPQAVERDRALSAEELGAVYAAAMHRPYPSGPFIRLLVLTGLRRDEVAGMRWSELNSDLSKWTVPAARMKNKKEHFVPLCDAARGILQAMRDGARLHPESDFVFTTTGTTPLSGFSNFKAVLDADSGVSGWTLHDLRRTIATGMADLGVAHVVADKILAHNGSALDSVARIYQRNTFEAERTEAMRLWGEHVAAQAAKAAPAVAARIADNARQRAEDGRRKNAISLTARKATNQASESHPQP